MKTRPWRSGGGAERRKRSGAASFSGSCMWRKPMNHSCSPTVRGCATRRHTHVCMQTCMSTRTPVPPPPMTQTRREPPQFPQNMPDNQSSTHTSIPSNHPSYTHTHASIHVRSAFSLPLLCSLHILPMIHRTYETEGGNTKA